MSTQDEIDKLLSSFNSAKKEDIEDMLDKFEQNNTQMLEPKTEEEPKIKEKEPENQERLQGKLYPEEDHRVVDKLDEITKESEEKVNQLFELLENAVSRIDAMDAELKKVKPYLDEHKKFMDLFVSAFPKASVNKNYEYFSNVLKIFDEIQKTHEELKNYIFDSMDLLQFQDITRQKIEKVISVIQALHKYLNNWFASGSKVRARVAKTIADESQKPQIDQEVDDIVNSFQRGEIE
jgi:chemotaxis regulatin CheY-phosphate phosphatase CheZ